MPQDHKRQCDNHQPQFGKNKNSGYIHHDKRQVDRDIWIGLYVSNLSRFLARQLQYPSTQGVYVVRITKNGPAEDAGIKLGDIITAINDREVKTMAKVCLIGMGGLGSPTALKLVGMGIGYLRFVDRDIVSRSDSTSPAPQRPLPPPAPASDRKSAPP